MKRIIKKFAQKIVSLPRVRGLIYSAVAMRYGVVLYYDDPERSKILQLIRKIKTETEMLLGDTEAYQIFMVVNRTKKIRGDIAEVGTYKGGSSKLICEAKGNKPCHLFDTFEGLPNLNTRDNPKQFHPGQFTASLEDVKNYLKTYKNVYLYKGLFPATADAIKDKHFSFVHLDLDLHDPTLDSLEFFYPRMSKGGIIISHDYISAPGVRTAIDDFFKDKPEPIIELSGSQCLIVKI